MLRVLRGERRKLIRAWQWKHNSAGFDIIRIFLGGALIVRGIWFIMHPEAVAEMAGTVLSDWLTAYLNFAHLVGGAMLVVGFWTRIGALIQIPVLVQAVFFVHMRRGIGTPDQSLELSALVLLLLVVIFIFGAGVYSVDYWRRRGEAA